MLIIIFQTRLLHVPVSQQRPAGGRPGIPGIQIPGRDVAAAMPIILVRLKHLNFPKKLGYLLCVLRYYMYEPIVDNTGPNLGKLALWTRSIDR